MASEAPSITRSAVPVRCPAGLAVLAAARGLDVLFVFFRVVVRFARRAIENSPRCKTGPTFKDDSRDAGAGRPFQPEAHEDLVDVGPANPDVSAADAFLDEAEGLVQPAGPVVRRKDREFRFLEALRSHPLEDSLHQEATESDFPPPVPDDDADPSDVAVFRIRPSIAVFPSHPLATRPPQGQPTPDSVEPGQPPPFLVKVVDPVDHDVDLFPADQVDVLERLLRLVDRRGPN